MFEIRLDLNDESFSQLLLIADVAFQLYNSHKIGDLKET